MNNITYIDQVEIRNKKVLVRVDYSVPLTEKLTIGNDARIRQSLPSIEYLLKHKNKIILISKLGRPKKRDPKLSLKPIAKELQKLFPSYKILLVDDFLDKKGQKQIAKQSQKEIILLENIRFYQQEKDNDPEFAKKLAALGDVFVNDAFSMSHRSEAAIVGIPKLLPSYGGLRLKTEITQIQKIIKTAAPPVVVILGGSKVSTKINLITRLMEVAQYFLIGGGMATTFLAAQGHEVGKSLHEETALSEARKILHMAKEKKTEIILPEEVVVGDPKDLESPEVVKKLEEVRPSDIILDIGPETEALYGSYIARAKTIIWNGPMGYFENPAFSRGTEFIYYAITQNQQATSLVGGGDTLAAISNEEYFDKITHISTGGGAMLELIEKGTLPGIEALKH